MRTHVSPPCRRALRRRTVAVGALLAALATLPAARAEAGPPPTLWTAIDGAPPAPRTPGVTTASAVRVDRGVLAALGAGDQVRLDLPDGAALVTIDEVRAQAPDRYALHGTLPGNDLADVIVAVHGSGVAGVLRLGSAGTYRLRGYADGRLRLERLDETAFPWCDLGAAGPGGPAGAQAAPRDLRSCDDGSRIDVVVPYTREARDAAGGTDNILAEIDLMLENMNVSFANTLVNPRMHLVYARELSTPQSQINLGNLTGRSDGVIDGVHDLRDLYGGDEVALVVSGGGGVANGMWSFDPEQEANAFCLNGRDSMPFIVAHEVGHNLGCCHARGDGGGCPPEGGLLFPYSNGHRWFGDSGQRWRTVMAYSPGVWSALYSNPDVLFDGVPTGVPEGEDDSADNVKTINNSAFTVANWRCADSTCEELDLPSDAEDCNDNDVPDLCEIASGFGADINGDGILDECQCVGDADGNGVVDTADLVIVLGAWGPCGEPCPGDLNADDVVNTADLLLVLGAWGGCG